MGGFVVKATTALTPIPVTRKQLLTLASRGYVIYPFCKEIDIKDKNKQDSLTRYSLD